MSTPNVVVHLVFELLIILRLRKCGISSRKPHAQVLQQLVDAHAHAATTVGTQGSSMQQLV